MSYWGWVLRLAQQKYTHKHIGSINMRKQSKYSRFHETYKVLKENFSSSTEIRSKLNLLSSEQLKYFLRAMHLMNLARKNKYLDLSLSGFLVSNSAEIMGHLIYRKKPTQNHFNFLFYYCDKSLLSKLCEEEKYEEISYNNEKKKPTSKVIRKIGNEEIINIYYSVVRCLFTHEGESHLATMDRRTVNCGTACAIPPYKDGRHTRYKFGSKWINKNTNRFIIVNFHYDTFEKLVLSGLVKYLLNP